MKTEFEKWWNEFWHKENKGMDFLMATRLAFYAGWKSSQQNIQSPAFREKIVEILESSVENDWTWNSDGRPISMFNGNKAVDKLVELFAKNAEQSVERTDEESPEN